EIHTRHLPGTSLAYTERLQSRYHSARSFVDGGGRYHYDENNKTAVHHEELKPLGVGPGDDKVKASSTAPSEKDLL
ncbi:unnamed protein product, partial [Amoebophrya sp. A120]